MVQDKLTNKTHKMKTASLLSLGLGFAMFSFGCSRTGEAQPPAQADTFEVQLLQMLPMLDDHHELHVQYSTDQTNGGSIPVFYIMPREEDSSVSRQIVCSGTGMGFAGCCKKWLDANPGKCLKVWQSGGTYYADDGC